MSKTKKCKYCQMDIPKKAKVCPNCKRTLTSHGCLISFLIFLVSIGFGILALILTISGSFAIGDKMNDEVQKSVSGVKDESEYITLEEFNKIQNGMSYEEVKSIIGSSGTLSSNVSMNGVTVEIYTWYGNGTAGSNANVTFTNNSVTGKAQAGLQ